MEKSGKGAKVAKAIPDGTETCGIVMPISAIDGCDASHWVNVLEILADAARSADYEPQLVSTGADIGVIQNRIVQNLYDNPIVVCDVSGKNPNVMFELGMRLAFDKPVIIVKDDATSYSFDTSPIEHLEYRRDLRYQNIIEFQKQLAQKIRATVEKSRSDEHYSPFLKNFGKFTVAKLDTQEVSSNEFLAKRMDDLQREISTLSSMLRAQAPQSSFDRIIAERLAAETNAVTAEHIAKFYDPVEMENRARKLIESEFGRLSNEELQQEDNLNRRIAKLKPRIGLLGVSSTRLQDLISEYLRLRAT